MAFWVCYIAVLLERIFQFKVFDNKYSSSEIFAFIKDFKVIRTEEKHINMSTATEFIDELSKKE